MLSAPNTKTKIDRKFTVMGNFCTIVKKYLNLRPTYISQTILLSLINLEQWGNTLLHF